MTDNREALMFKKVPEGHVFRAPNPWVLGRAQFYLVDEVQKAQLLAIVTARSQAVFWIVFAGLIAASTAALAYATGHDSPTARDLVIMLALAPVWIYAALLISIRPTARRLQPLLADLPRTDQRITAADRREAVRKTASFQQDLMLGVSQAITAAAMIVLVWQKTNGGRVALFEARGAPIFAFAAFVFVVSSIRFLLAALDKARRQEDEPLPAVRSFKSVALPTFCLVVSILVLGFVVANAVWENARHQKATLVRDELDRGLILPRLHHTANIGQMQFGIGRAIS